jgi:hypothetical protein
MFALALVLATLLAAQPQLFSFAGISLASDLKSVAARYPNSSPQASYISIAPKDSHDHISAIEISGSGPGRRIRIAFEMQKSDGRPTYPSCRDVEMKLTRAYGRPHQIRRFSEEASRRADRAWRSETEELVLLCFDAGRGRLYAEAVQITARQGKTIPR